MSRFCVVTLALCAASLLALQFFISLTPVHAQASPSVTITSPAAGSWHNASFPVGYATLNAGSCKLSTKDGGAGWVDRGAISCGAGRTTTIDAGAWCTTQGLNQCGVQIQGTPLLVVNGDFQTEDPTPPPPANQGTYFAVDTFPGWTVESGSIDLGWWPSSAAVDLSGRGPGVIYQDIQTQAGKSYRLRFAIGGNAYNKQDINEPPIKNMRVWWNGSPVGIFSFDTLACDCEGWDYHELSVTAAGSTTRLKFESLTPTAFGPLLDDVSLVDPSLLPIPVNSQRFFSIDATNPVVQITAPGSGSTQASDFPITYNATDDHIDSCTLSPSSDNGATWDSKATVSCGGTGLTANVSVAWCQNFSFPQCGIRVSATDLAGNTAFADLFVNYTPPIPYGFVPCGGDRDNPETDWKDMEPFQFRHFFLLVKILLDFTLWKLTPLIIVLLAVATGVIFYFQLGDVSVLATVRRIWHYVGIGVLILLFSWLFLNFLLGILGFDINIFGRWTEIAV